MSKIEHLTGKRNGIQTERMCKLVKKTESPVDGKRKPRTVKEKMC